VERQVLVKHMSVHFLVQPCFVVLSCVASVRAGTVCKRREPAGTQERLPQKASRMFELGAACDTSGYRHLQVHRGAATRPKGETLKRAGPILPESGFWTSVSIAAGTVPTFRMGAALVLHLERY
jgi:hypothetical protein